MRSLFPARLRKSELLPALRAGRLHCGGRQLTKSEEDETIITNCLDRSTYPQEKSVLTSGAIPCEGRDVIIQRSSRRKWPSKRFGARRRLRRLPPTMRCTRTR